MNSGFAGELWLLEDSEADAEMFAYAAAATSLPASVRHFKTAEEILRAVLAGDAPPALMLVDLNLPGLDGRDLIARLKAREAYRTVPLVVLSSSSNRNEVARAYEAGACAYLVKPLGIERYEELLRAVGDFWFKHSIRPGFSTPASKSS